MSRFLRTTESGRSAASVSSTRSCVKRALRASCDLLNPAKYQRSLAALSITVNAHAVVHSAPACRRSRPPARLANSVSPAQNDGSIGVIGDCKVAKKPGHVGQRIDAQQTLGLDEAQQQHDAAREHEAHQHQDVARAARRKHVHQQQRRAGAGSDGNDAERRHSQQRRHVEHARRAARDADAEQHRQQKDDDHPRRLQHGLHETRVEQPPDGHRRREQQAQIFGQEECRERRDDAAEREEREEREEQPRQPDAQQEIAELVVRVELRRNPEGAPEQRARTRAGPRRRTATRARNRRARCA